MGPGAPMRSTIRRGSTGADVGVAQRILGLAIDEQFGPLTEASVRAFQRAHDLHDDGIVGQQTWRALGETPILVTPPKVGPSAACRAALRDANATWPSRKKASDGIMGDAAHQARKSDHNTGLAVDITHDPDSGCNGVLIAMMARRDPRVTYTIFRSRIWNREIDHIASPGRVYKGSNPHEKHVHISVREDARDDGSPWPWATT